MPKCDFNKDAKQFYWNHTSAWFFSCNFAAYFQNSFFFRTPLNGCFCKYSESRYSTQLAIGFGIRKDVGGRNSSAFISNLPLLQSYVSPLYLSKHINIFHLSQIFQLILAIFVWRFTNAYTKIYRYLRLYVKMTCRGFHIITPLIPHYNTSFWDIHTRDIWNNSGILRIMNAKCSGNCFYMNPNIQ